MAILREKLNGTIGVFLFFNTPEAKNKLYITGSRKIILKYHHYEVSEGLYVFLDNKTDTIYYYNLEQVCNFSFYEKNMENELKIEIPKGKEVDWEKSAKEGKIILKDEETTYTDIAKKLFLPSKNCFYINRHGEIHLTTEVPLSFAEPNNATISRQLECILAKNLLANVARYLNGDWAPVDNVWYITCYYRGDVLVFESCQEKSDSPFCSSRILFKSKEMAQKAINILGRHTLTLALEPLY